MMNLLKNIGKEKILKAARGKKTNYVQRNKSETNARLLMRSYRSQRTME